MHPKNFLFYILLFFAAEGEGSRRIKEVNFPISSGDFYSSGQVVYASCIISNPRSDPQEVTVSYVVGDASLANQVNSPTADKKKYVGAGGPSTPSFTLNAGDFYEVYWCESPGCTAGNPIRENPVSATIEVEGDPGYVVVNCTAGLNASGWGHRNAVPVNGGNPL